MCDHVGRQLPLAEFLPAFRFCLARPSVLAADPLPAKPTAKTVKVAAVQCSSDLGDVAGNTKKLTALVKEAAKNGAKLVVLPETAITGYLSQDLKTNWHVKGMPIEPTFRGRDPKDSAEKVPGASTKHFCALAKELDIYLTIPFLEVDFTQGKDRPRYFNTVCLASPKGELVAHYRKLTPWPFPEKSWAKPGDPGLQTHDTEYGASASASASTSTPSSRSTNRTTSGACSTRSPGWTTNIRPSGCSTGCLNA